MPEKPIPTGCGSDLLRLKTIPTVEDYQIGKGYIQSPLCYLLFDLASCFSRWRIIPFDITGEVFKLSPGDFTLDTSMSISWQQYGSGLPPSGYFLLLLLLLVLLPQRANFVKY